MPRDLIRIAISLLAVVSLSAQDAPHPMFHVRIVDGITAEPLGGVSVDVRCFDRYPASTRWTFTGSLVTDGKGDALFDAAEPGVCVVMNTLKPGFSMRPNENVRPYDVLAGETLRIVRIWKTPDFHGTLRDERDRPLAGVPILFGAERAQNPAGRPAAVTNDKGEFALGFVGTAPFTLLLPSIALSTPVPTWTLRYGEVRTVELRGRRKRSFKVSGRVASSDGKAQQVALYRDLAEWPDSAPKTFLTARSDAAGRFTFPEVPEGSYRIRVDTGGPGSSSLANEALWANVPVTVSRDIDGLPLALARMPDVRGILRFSGGAGPPDGRSLLRFDPIDGPGGRLQAGMIGVGQGGFVAAGLRPGRYVLRVSGAPPGWHLQSAVAGGRDIADLPFEIAASSPPIDDLVVTFTDRQTSLSGAVTSEQQPDRNATVYVFPADPQFWMAVGSTGWRVRQALTNSNGRYGFPDLPPGEYLIAAARTEEVPELRTVDAAFLARLARVASAVHIAYDVPVTLDLQRVTPPGGG